MLGIAGVMGGMYGEVTAENQEHPAGICALRSGVDRAFRTPSQEFRLKALPVVFERGVDDPVCSPAAAQMAAELMIKYGNGEPSEHPTDFNTVSDRRPILFKSFGSGSCGRT